MARVDPLTDTARVDKVRGRRGEDMEEIPMRHFENRTPRRGLAAMFMVGSAALLSAACSSAGSSSSSSDPTVSQSYDALASDLAKCAETARGCLRDANGDPAKQKTCLDQAKACQDASRASDEALRKAIGACIQSALECRRNGRGGDGGPAMADCRDELRMCIEQALPPPSGAGGATGSAGATSAAGGTTTAAGGATSAGGGATSTGGATATAGATSATGGSTSAAGGSTSAAGSTSTASGGSAGHFSGFPGRPGFPPVPTGLPSGLPPLQPPPCLEALNQCVQGGKGVQECVQQARECVMKGLMPPGTMP
jgi:hypothetical protein